MNALAAFLTLSFMLTICNLTGGKSSDSSVPNTDEEKVKTRITEFFDHCKSSNYEKAASYVGNLKGRGDEKLNPLDYSTDEGKKQSEGVCKELSKKINYNVKFIKSNRQKAIVAWEMEASPKPVILAFTQSKGNWILIDVD